MVTIKDVAKEAGVSYSTVSVVLGNRSTPLAISEATRNRVMETAKRIGYRRNGLASQIISGKTNVITFAAHFLKTEYTFRVIAGAAAAAEQNGYYLKIVNLRNPHDDRIGLSEDEMRNLVDKLLEQRPAALLINTERDMDYLIQSCRECGIPIVLCDNTTQKNVSANYATDYAAGMHSAVEYLYSMGHRDIGYFADFPTRSSDRAKFNGFETALRDFNLPENPDWIHRFSYYYTHEVRERLKKIFSRIQRPTAFCCDSDHLAVKVMTGLSRIGLRIPEDVSVIGYGGMHITELTDPVLTSISQNFEELGRRSVEYIVKVLTHPETSGTYESIPTILLKGESVANINKIKQEVSL